MSAPSPSRIPFNRPFIAGRELEYVAQAVEQGNLAGNGPFTRRCCDWLERRFHARRVLLTHSCTGALEMAAMLADVGAGDEVIVPSYTFVSTVNAFVLRGARPVFVDIRPDTLNLDETRLEAAITPRTKVICPVHYAGVGCEMDTIMELAARQDLFVVEDAALGVDATYRGRALGTIGQLGCYSFHETKNFISGEGGALVVNDESLEARAEILRDKGTDRSRFDRGEVDRYTWVDIGSSYLASELVAAFLCAQLEEAERITARRRGTYSFYFDALAALEDRGHLRRPVAPDECEHPASMFHVLLQDESTRSRLIAHLAERDIHAVFHYVPLHTSPMGRSFGYGEGDLPVTEDVAARLLRLPCWYGLTEVDLERVVDGLFTFFR